VLRRNEEARKRWGGQLEALDNWLDERQAVLVQYFQLAGLPPYEKSENNGKLPSVDAVHSFCESLVDYISAGHFELYDKIIEQAGSQAEKAAELADKIYPMINRTTEIALDFNDHFAELSTDDDWSHFDTELSKLGEAVEIRLELEDKLLQLLSNHDLLPENK